MRNHCDCNALIKLENFCQCNEILKLNDNKLRMKAYETSGQCQWNENTMLIKWDCNVNQMRMQY